MKSSLIRSFVIFTAGAATAALASDLYRQERVSVEEFRERADFLLAEVAALGAFVGVAENGRVGIYSNTIAACVTPKPPLPVLPSNGVDIRPLELGTKALAAYNVGLLMGDTAPVYEIDRCRPVERLKY